MILIVGCTVLMLLRLLGRGVVEGAAFTGRVAASATPLAVPKGAIQKLAGGEQLCATATDNTRGATTHCFTAS